MKLIIIILLYYFSTTSGFAQSEIEFPFVPRDLNLIDSVNISDLDRSKSFNLHRTILNDSIFVDSQILCVSFKNECAIKLLKSYNGDWLIESDQKWALFYDNSKQELQSFQISSKDYTLLALPKKKAGKTIVNPFYFKTNEGYESDKNTTFLFHPAFGVVGIITAQTNLIRYDFSQQILNSAKNLDINDNNTAGTSVSTQSNKSCLDTATVYLKNEKCFNDRMGVAFLNSYYCEKRFYFYTNKWIKKNCQPTEILYGSKKINICKNSTYFLFKTKAGSLIAEGNWNIEYFSGFYKDYYPNGNIKSEGEKFSDCKVNKWNYYNAEGKRIREEIYDEMGILISSSNF